MKQNLLSHKLCLLILCFLSIASLAQKTPQQLQEIRNRVLADPKVEELKISEERQTPTLISFKSNVGAYTKDQSRPVLENYLNSRQGIDYLVMDKETKLFSNMEVVEFQQYFKGVKVEYSKFKAFVKNGNVEFFNGSWYDIPNGFNIHPRLSREAALKNAKGSVNARKYATDDLQEKLSKANNSAAREILEKELEDVSPKGELVIVKDFTQEGIAQVKLAYKFDIYALDPVSRAWIYVDAESGKIVLVDPIIKHANKNPVPTSVPVIVETRYAGKRSINVKQVSGNDPNSGQILVSSHPTTEVYQPGANTWVLIDDTRGGGIETYDFNQGGGTPVGLVAVNNLLYANGKSFTDVDNNWTTAEHRRNGTLSGAAEAENDDIAWDAHWGAGVVYDYWKQNQNRLSFDNNNAKIKSFVHVGQGYDNAYWNGKVMSYGDGSYAPPAKNTGYKALTSLDVCAHEIGHGVCTFTSNLVYEKESGAMNEGFSDIWAACVEYYAIKSIDPAFASQFKPFYIGEQIAPNPAVPLRRMDSPKARNNPDTYGGERWSNPDCAPDLVNDYCGVHNNSGVLNKWFYLLTVGSGAGSGPDAAYAGEDDGVNDHGKVYEVTGLGFSMSEKIAYMTELLLTSTAKFAEARNVSIQIATEISGNPCSDLVKQVTNAWYAVGVGNEFVEPCTPASITFGFIHQPGIAVKEGDDDNGCNVTKTISIPVLLPANSTGTVTLSGSATLNSDYTVASASVSNNTSSTATAYFEISIKNDAVIETDESIVLNLAVTNIGTNSLNNVYTLSILEDDFNPILGGGSKQLLSETFTRGDGFADPAGWTEVLETAIDGTVNAAKGHNQWGVFNNKLAITGKDHVTGVTYPAGTYNNLSASKTYIKSPLIDAAGLSQVSISFDFRVQGEFDPEKVHADDLDFERLPAFDYMAVMYSLDGVNFTELNTGDFRQFVAATPSEGSFRGVLPASVGNKKFYIAFRWFNDTNAGGPESVTIDNLVISGSPRLIENDPNHSSNENLNASSDVYFYSQQDGEVLGRLNNTSTKNFGCTGLTLTRTGNNAVLLYKGTDGDHKVSEKTISINTELSNTKSPVTVYLYFNEAQIKALEDATGKLRSRDFSIYQTNATSIAIANASNTTKVAASYVALPGVGGYFSATFSSKLGNSLYAIGVPPAATKTGGGGPKRESYSSAEVNEIQYNWSIGNIYPNPARNSAFVEINSPDAKILSVELVNLAGQLMKRQQVQIAPGTNRINVQVGSITPGAYLLRIRETNGKLLGTKQFIKE